MGFNPNEPRDNQGQWTAGDATTAIQKAASDVGKIDDQASATIKMANYNPSEDEKWAVDRYTAGDFVMNKSLRFEKDLTKKQEKIRTNLDNFLQNAPKAQMESYRTITLSENGYKAFKEKAAIGNVLNDKGFMSTTLDKSRAEFTGQTNVNYGMATTVLITIKGKSGVYLSKFSAFDNEKEVLFGRNTKLKVANVRERIVDNEAGKKIKVMSLNLEEI